jgi:hypothetical protein
MLKKVKLKASPPGFVENIYEPEDEAREGERPDTLGGWRVRRSLFQHPSSVVPLVFVPGFDR